MNSKQFLLLLIPSALWGSSFIFMKELAPIFGPILTSTLRILFASLFLIVLFTIQKYPMKFKEHWKHYLIIGIGNSAIPFSLYAYAALYIPSNLSVILNSTSPMFGALFGFLLLQDRLSFKKIIGVMLGTIGVGVVSSLAFYENSLLFILSILACLGAALLYGLSGAYVKKYASEIEPKQITVGSLTFASIGLIFLSLILYIGKYAPAVQSEFLLLDLGKVLMFGILCTSIPYIVYYKLLQEIGPVKALTVTYLMPIFGIIWSVLYGESVSMNAIIGLIIILSGIRVLSLEKSTE